MRRVTLLLCGEPMRGDDAVAAAVIAALPAGTLGMVDVRHVGQLMPDDLMSTDGPVILVDAVEGLTPGEVVDLPLASLAAAHAAGISPGSSHALPLPITLGIVERLRGGLPEGRFVGVAGAAYGIGAPLSGAVREAVPACAARLSHWIRVLAHGSRSPVCA
jgi:hydrogenase maturation protease